MQAKFHNRIAHKTHIRRGENNIINEQQLSVDTAGYTKTKTIQQIYLLNTSSAQQKHMVYGRLIFNILHENEQNFVIDFDLFGYDFGSCFRNEWLYRVFWIDKNV